MQYILYVKTEKLTFCNVSFVDDLSSTLASLFHLQCDAHALLRLAETLSFPVAHPCHDLGCHSSSARNNIKRNCDRMVTQAFQIQLISATYKFALMTSTAEWLISTWQLFCNKLKQYKKFHSGGKLSSQQCVWSVLLLYHHLGQAPRSCDHACAVWTKRAKVNLGVRSRPTCSLPALNSILPGNTYMTTQCGDSYSPSWKQHQPTIERLWTNNVQK